MGEEAHRLGFDSWWLYAAPRVAADQLVVDRCGQDPVERPVGLRDGGGSDRLAGTALLGCHVGEPGAPPRGGDLRQLKVAHRRQAVLACVDVVGFAGFWPEVDYRS